MSLLLVPVVASVSLAWHEVLTVSYETGRNNIGLYGKHEPAIFSFIRHGRWSAGAHDEEKRETSESI